MKTLNSLNLSAISITLLLATGTSAYGSAAFRTGIFLYGPTDSGNVLNGELTNFVWKPGTFALPGGSTNNVLSGVFNPLQDFVYGFEVDNDRLGTLPVTSFLASNPNKKLINSIGWIADSTFRFSTKDIAFINNLSGVDIAAAAPVAPGFPPQIRYTFANPIPDSAVSSPLAPRSDVFYFTSPIGPTIVSGLWESTNDGATIQVSGNHFAPAVPEPTSTLALLAFGTLGAASAFKHKQNQKSTEKETTKVG